MCVLLDFRAVYHVRSRCNRYGWTLRSHAKGCAENGCENGLNYWEATRVVPLDRECNHTLLDLVNPSILFIKSL
jgi:hypothetical protein